MEIENSQSRVSSKSSNRSSSKKKVNPIDLGSDDISMSQLELLANKKKLNKKSEEISIENNKNNVDAEADEIKKDDIVSIISAKKSKLSSSTRKYSSSSSSSGNNDKYERRKINKENKNEGIRKEKSELLFKLHTVIERSNSRWSTKLNMDNSLDEIRNEFTRIKAILDNEAMVKFCKHGLVMGIKGVELLNNTYDPLGVDLDGWGEAMSYNMATTEYDEVLSELCEKYKGTGSMSPEVKLLVMIVMSGAMFSFSKKAAKDPNTLTNLMSSFMSKKPAQPAPQQQQAPQQFYQQPPIRQQQQQHFQSQSHHQQQFNAGSQQANFSPFVQPNRIPTLNELHNQRDVDTEDSDNIPSKIRGPSFETPDSVNIENIIKTMKEKNNQKERNAEVKIRPDIEQILNETETSDDIVRNIPAPKIRGKGRPRKTKQPTRNA